MIKFSHDDNTDLMHYVVYEGDVVVLSKEDSKKISYAKKHKELEVSFHIDSKEYEMIMDIILLYGKKNFEGYKNMSIRNLSDYIEKKYNKKLVDSHIHGIRERELKKNAKHWNSFYA